MVPADIPLKSASNLRDLGGWPTQDGRRIRTGLVFRAAALSGLCTEDEAVLSALGLRATVDFRGMWERQHQPVAIAGTVGHTLPIEPSVGPGLTNILRTGRATGQASADDIMDLLREAYRDYALQNVAQYRGLFDLLVQDDSLPLLFHCSAGKDRTGFAAALVLSALGVAWADVMQDYLATNRFWRREIASTFQLPQGVAGILLGAHETLLESAFEALRGEHGSLDAYFAGPLGLDADKRARLSSRLLAG